MDRRLEIFSLWKDPLHESLRNLVQSISDIRKIQEYEGLVSKIGSTFFDCFLCGKHYCVTKDCITWIIASNPVKYLKEDDCLLCRDCSGNLKYQKLCTIRELHVVPHNGQKVMDIVHDTRIKHRRYVYNTKHRSYIEIEKVTKSEYLNSFFEQKSIVYRALNPLHNPFFKIESTLFDILFVELQDRLTDI